MSQSSFPTSAIRLMGAAVAVALMSASSAHGQFSAMNTELLSQIPLNGFSGSPTSGNDCWGYVSPSGREYALMCISNALAVVEVTNPRAPVIVGQIPHTNSQWGDVKVYQHYCYVSNESGGGIDVVDLSQVDNGIVTLVQRFAGAGVNTTHNVALNPQSGYLYLCGSNIGSGRLMAVSLANPAAPVFAGQVSSAQGAYSHDAQIVTYTSGPYAGREIAFSCNGGVGFDIYDVTDKSNMFRLSRSVYPNLSYCHQGWLSEDRRYFYLNDETDGVNETVIFDVTNLAAPVLVGTYNSGIPATDHNLYVRGQYIFEADYRGGARIFCAADPERPVQVGWFDTYPENNNSGYQGAWSIYPFLPSGILLISDINRGLFMVDVSASMTVGSIAFAYPDGRPQIVHPDGGTLIRAEIAGACGGTLNPASPRLHVNSGAESFEIPMTAIGPGLYEAAFPAISCGEAISYHLSAVTSTGQTHTSPFGAPSSGFGALSADGIGIDFDDNFETDTGWTPANLGASTGAWQRGVPVIDPGWPYSPTADADGSGQCWLTQNTTGNSDVDGGSVRLTSPALDLTAENVELTFYYYLRLTDTSGADRLVVEMSSNGDAGPWIELAAFTTDSGSGTRHEQSMWEHVHLHGDDITAAGLTLTANMKVRFTATDADPGHIVEAGVDGVIVRHVVCEPECGAGDVNCDGSVDVDDLIAVILGWGPCPPPPPACPADLVPNGTVDVDDLIEVILNWG